MIGLPGNLTILQGVNTSFPDNMSKNDFSRYKNPSLSWIIATNFNVMEDLEPDSNGHFSDPASPPNFVPPVHRYSATCEHLDHRHKDPDVQVLLDSNKTRLKKWDESPITILSCRLFTLHGPIQISTPSGIPLDPYISFPVRDIPRDRFGFPLRNWTYLDSTSIEQSNDIITWVFDCFESKARKLHSSRCPLTVNLNRASTP